jgi:hypothetical protein
LFVDLAGSLEGDTDHRPPLILLHGLTFDRMMWRPAQAELRLVPGASPDAWRPPHGGPVRTIVRR